MTTIDNLLQGQEIDTKKAATAIVEAAKHITRRTLLYETEIGTGYSRGISIDDRQVYRWQEATGTWIAYASHTPSYATVIGKEELTNELASAERECIGNIRRILQIVKEAAR